MRKTKYEIDVYMYVARCASALRPSELVIEVDCFFFCYLKHNYKCTYIIKENLTLNIDRQTI